MPEYTVDNVIFSWNELKADRNETKHGVSFEEAATAFGDVNAKLYDDIEHTGVEKRFILLGYSKISKLLIVCHCYRGKDDDIVRIISARKANRQERRKYEERD